MTAGTRRILGAGFVLVAALSGLRSGLKAGTSESTVQMEPPAARPAVPAALQSDLDRIFGDPILARALIGARVESLRDGRVVYAHNDDKLVMPASNMKVVTLAVAADTLGWDFRFRTALDAVGTVEDGTLRGDLVVTGGGDPSIGSANGEAPSPLFVEWAEALRRAGIRRVDGRLIGDDDYFDDDGLGMGWSWDDLSAGYAAPSGALSYNENAVTVRIRPGPKEGDAATVAIGPPGHPFTLVNHVRSAASGTAVAIDIARAPGSPILTATGTVPAGAAVLTRTAAVDRPTQFFVDALKAALASRGITVSGAACDIDEAGCVPASGTRRSISVHESQPLATLAGYYMKVSQNFYAETMLKTVGRVAGAGGTSNAGRDVVQAKLAAWGIPADAIVIRDGSGLSRYNYVTAGAMVTILRRMWESEPSRAPFTAALPVAGHDGTLDTRMQGTILDARVEAKTGTISNVRALSGYLETRSGERLAFSIIANHFTAASKDVDAIVERALARIAAQ